MPGSFSLGRQKPTIAQPALVEDHDLDVLDMVHHLREDDQNMHALHHIHLFAQRPDGPREREGEADDAEQGDSQALSLARRCGRHRGTLLTAPRQESVRQGRGPVGRARRG